MFDDNDDFFNIPPQMLNSFLTQHSNNNNNNNVDDDNNINLTTLNRRKRSLGQTTHQTIEQNDFEKQSFLKAVRKVVKQRIGRNIASQNNPNIPTFIMYNPKRMTGDMHSVMSSIVSEENHRLVHNVFSQTIIFKSSMISGSTKFKDFRLGEDVGLCDYLSLLFGIKLFADPRHGINECGEHTDFTFKFEGNILPKTEIYIEPLVKKVEFLDPLSLFLNGNVVGYRIWYIIQDPAYNPIETVLSLIKQYRYAAGDCTPIKLYTEEESPFAEELANYQPGTIEYDTTIKNMTRANKQIMDLQKSLNEARTSYSKELDANSNRPEFMLHTIVSNSIYYQMIQQHLMRCLKCVESVEGTCSACKLLNDNISRYRRPTIENEGDLWETLKNIRFAPLTPASMTQVVMDSMNWGEGGFESNDNWLMHMTLNPIFGYSGIISQKQVSILQAAGVCAEQCNALNYRMKCPSTGRRIQKFFSPKLLFRIDPKAIIDIDAFFKDNEFPWVFNSSDIMLEVGRKIAKSKHRSRQDAHIKRHCLGFQSIPCVDDAIARSDAYESHFQDNASSNFFDSKPLDKNSFPGAKYTISDPDAVSKSIQRVVELKDDSDTYFESMADRLKALDQLRSLLPESICDYIYNTIQQEGVVAFGSMFNSTNPNITQLQRNAAKMIEDACGAFSTEGFSEIQTIDTDIGFDGSTIITLLMYFGYQHEDIIDNHIVAFTALLATYRSSHPYLLESLIKAPDIVPGIVNQGTAGTGKSNLLKVLINILVKNTVSQISSHSLRADAIASKYLGQLFTSDELNSQNDAFMAAMSGNMSTISNFKEAMTRFVTTHKVLRLNDDGSRIQDFITTLWHCAYLINANNWRRTPGEASFYQRWDVFFALANQPLLRYENNTASTSNITGSALPTKPNSIKNITPCSLSKRTLWMRLTHALVIQASLAMQTGTLPYPNMSLLGIYYNVIEKHMLLKFPRFNNNARTLTRIYAYAISLVVYKAIQMVWTSELSPFLNYTAKSNGHTIDTRSMSKNSIILIAPYLQATESICIFQITSTILQQVFPSKIWLMLFRIVSTFCGYGTANVIYGKYINAAQETDIDKNYYHVDISYEKLIAWANLQGCNEHTLTEMLTYMEQIDVCVDHVFANGTNGSEKKMKVVEILGRDMLAEKSSGPMANVSMPITIPKSARVKILVEYIEKWSPDQLKDYIMKGFEHAHIRPRKVVIGDTIPGSPQLFATYDLKVNPSRVIKLHSSGLDNSFMSHHIAPPTSISHETQRLNEAQNKSVTSTTVFNQDIEESVLLPWLIEHKRFLPEEYQRTNNYREFLPSVYDKSIQNLKQTHPIYNSTISHNDYPAVAGPLPEYNRLLHPKHPYLEYYKQNQSISNIIPPTLTSFDPTSDSSLGFNEPSSLRKNISQGQSIVISKTAISQTPGKFNRGATLYF